MTARLQYCSLRLFIHWSVDGGDCSKKTKQQSQSSKKTKQQSQTEATIPFSLSMNGPRIIQSIYQALGLQKLLQKRKEGDSSVKMLNGHHNERPDIVMFQILSRLFLNAHLLLLKISNTIL